jgi:hypothetical protein
VKFQVPELNTGMSTNIAKIDDEITTTQKSPELVQGDLFEWAAQQDESELGFAARSGQ